jgi:aryl-alcohol dehydrogenase-like predicted oxidoreductase
MIEKIPFGRTGHHSSRILFGAAALGGMRQEKADAVLSMVRDYGINHFDVAASYGDAELRLAPFLQDHRDEVFLATKTGDRSRDGAMASIERSLERLQVEQLDLIQFHNLAQEADWAQVMGKGGALEAAVAARDQGLVRFIGVTGHGTKVADMHLRSLAHFDFAAILLPYSHTSMLDAQYAASFEKLYLQCQQKGVAIQTIKAIARRRWRDDDEAKRFSWYEPIREEAALRRAIHWVFRRPGLFLNSSSDATLLQMIFAAAADFDSSQVEGIEAAVAADVAALEQEPLFVRDVLDDVF